MKPNFVARKMSIALASALEPLAKEIINIAVDVGAVPVCLAESIGAVEVDEAFFVAATGAVGTAERHEAGAESNDLRTIAS